MISSTNTKEAKKSTKCSFCKVEITDDRAIEVCDRCGHGIWGPKMFGAIISNMGDRRDKGDLYQGSVTSSRAA